MKKYLLLGLISALALNGAVIIPTSTENITTVQPHEDKELAWVDEQIQAMNGSKLLAPPKLGSSIATLSQPKGVEEPLRLLAVMNKSVLITGKWYKIGDSVRNFTLSEVKQNSVLLTGKKDQKLILFLTKQNNNIKIITK